MKKIHECANALELIPDTADSTGKGATALEIFNYLPVPKGRFYGKRIGEVGLEWQAKLIKYLFGHVDDQGKRIIQQCFLRVAKKNSKSSSAAALAIAFCLIERPAHGLIAVVAQTRDGSKLVWSHAKAIIINDEYLRQRFRIREQAGSLLDTETECEIKIFANEASATTGLEGNLVIVDELHLWNRPSADDIFDQLEKGQLLVDESLLISITTAPFSIPGGPYERIDRYARRVVSGEVIDPSFLPILYDVDPRIVDPDNPSNWWMANPSMGTLFDHADLVREFEKSRTDPVAISKFRSQRLNIPPSLQSGAPDRWLAVQAWDQAADESITLEGIIEHAERTVVGIDRGGLDDATAVVVAGEWQGVWRFWSKQWLAEEAVKRYLGTNPYFEFIQLGELEVTTEADGDLEGILDIIDELKSTSLISVALDRYGMTETKVALEADGIHCTPVPQTAVGLLPGLAFFERAMADGRAVHAGQRMLRWNISHAVLSQRGNARMISKDKASGKIDGVAALIDAAVVIENLPALRLVNVAAMIG